MEVSPEVRFRSNLGRFMAACKAAKTRSVRRCIELGADRARVLAPEGEFEDARGPTLRESIEPVMLSDSHGVFVARARHAMAIERGAGPHQIGTEGQILADLEKPFGPVRGPVDHPGNAPQPYMKPAAEIVKSKQIGIMREEYP